MLKARRYVAHTLTLELLLLTKLASILTASTYIYMKVERIYIVSRQDIFAILEGMVLATVLVTVIGEARPHGGS